MVKEIATTTVIAAASRNEREDNFPDEKAAATAQFAAIYRTHIPTERRIIPAVFSRMNMPRNPVKKFSPMTENLSAREGQTFSRILRTNPAARSG